MALALVLRELMPLERDFRQSSSLGVMVAGPYGEDAPDPPVTRLTQIICFSRLSADLERLRADSRAAESRLQGEAQRAESRARLAQADAERQKAALDKERRYSATKDQVASAARIS